MKYDYRWIRMGEVGKCRCGGMLWRYEVQPRRSSAYLNVVAVCDNPECEEMAVRAGTDRERRGRMILA